MKNIFILFLFTAFISCSDEYFDKKPDKSLVVPTTLTDLEGLLNNSGLMNVGPGLGILGVDDFFMTDEGWKAFVDPVEQYGYTWQSDIYHGNKSCSEWSLPYQEIFYANTVLEALSKITQTDKNAEQWNTLKGRALFHRAISHYQIAQLFCQSYSAETKTQPGIPLRLNTDIAAPISRGSVEGAYAQIISDLKEAESLLPLTVSSPTQPSVSTAKGLLSIVYLSMSNYSEAEKYSSQSLDLNNTLMDFNELNAAASRPIPLFNEEVSFYSVSNYYSFPISPLAYIDTLLYKRYDDNDLRKVVYFRSRGNNHYTFKAHFSGIFALFTGIGIDEIYLTNAEAKVRNGNIDAARATLNSLLIKRWKTGTYIPFTETNSDELLSIIISERQKEMIYRPSRWTDVRRLNRENHFQRTMSRKLNGITYSITPNDNRYVYPFPQDEISLSGIEQNPR